MRPWKYQFMYHLKNIRKIEDRSKMINNSIVISKDDKDILGNPVIDDNFDNETEWINT